MKPNSDQPRAPESKPGSKPDSKDDLKSLPMPELRAKLGSSPDGLTQAEARKRLAHYAAGAKTYFGKTAQLVQEAHTVSHFQKAVLKIGN